MTTHSLDLTLSEPGAITLATRSGLVIDLRPATLDDTAALAALFASISPEEMRFRFLDSRKRLSAEQVAELIPVDRRHNEHLLAFDVATGRLVASLMIAADPHMDAAEAAIVVAPDSKGRGLGWTLLKHAAELARERGLHRLCSIESRDNFKALEVERALGFSTRDYNGDPTLVLVEAMLR